MSAPTVAEAQGSVERARERLAAAQKEMAQTRERIVKADDAGDQEFAILNEHNAKISLLTDRVAAAEQSLVAAQVEANATQVQACAKATAKLREASRQLEATAEIVLTRLAKDQAAFLSALEVAAAEFSNLPPQVQDATASPWSVPLAPLPARRRVVCSRRALLG